MKLTLSYSEAQDKISASHGLSYDQVEILGVPAAQMNVPVPNYNLMVTDPVTGEVCRKLDIQSVSNSLAAMLAVINANRHSGAWVDKITLIKAVRNLSGWGLKDAKDFVERYI